MRKALDQPAMLVERFEFAQTEGPTLLQLGRDRLPGAGKIWSCPTPGGACVLTIWETGAAALEARHRAVLAPRWRALASLMGAQPIVHLVAAQGLDWPELPPKNDVLLMVMTADAGVGSGRRGRAARSMPGREVLPAVEGVELWPVVGHPGRLMAWCEAQRWDEERLAQTLAPTWGPLAESPDSVILRVELG